MLSPLWNFIQRHVSCGFSKKNKKDLGETVGVNSIWGSLIFHFFQRFYMMYMVVGFIVFSSLLNDIR
jgi:hypothetical protein